MRSAAENARLAAADAALALAYKIAKADLAKGGKGSLTRYRKATAEADAAYATAYLDPLLELPNV